MYESKDRPIRCRRHAQIGNGLDTHFFFFVEKLYK